MALCRSFVLALCLALPAVASAVPMQLNHQGRLSDSAGVPVDGEHTLIFSLYSTPTGGTPLWTEPMVLDVVDGYYSVYLGEDELGNPLEDELFAGNSLWLGLAVDTGAELSPRMAVVSVPWARRAGTATHLIGGIVDAAEIRVDGKTVIDSSGQLVAPISPDVETSWSAVVGKPAVIQEFEALLACADGDVLVRDAGIWSCAPSEVAAAATWAALGGIPDDFADDVDNDSLADLSCGDGDVLVMDSGIWGCEAPTVADAVTWATLAGIPEDFFDEVDADSFAALDCDDGEVPTVASGVWTCAAPAATPTWSTLAGVPAGLVDGVDADTLESLGCSTGQVAVRGVSGWTCVTPTVPTWATLTGKPAGFADDVDADSLAALGVSCDDGDVVSWVEASGAFVCAAPLTVSDVLDAIDAAGVAGDLVVNGALTAGGLDVVGDAAITGDLDVSNDLTVDGDLLLGGDLVALGTVSGATLVSDGGVQLGDDTGPCNPAKAGTLRYSAARGQLELCDGAAWGVALGAARTCKQLLAANPSATTGQYTLDPDGAGGLPAFDAWCDMTTEGGGWTLLAKSAASAPDGEKRSARKADWQAYTREGIGRPGATHSIYWLPLDHWSTLTLAFPQNVIRVEDSIAADVRAQDLEVGGPGTDYTWKYTALGGYTNIMAGALSGRKFTTWDNDNDAWGNNCAVDNVGYNGGFWYIDCYQLSLVHATDNIYAWNDNAVNTTTLLKVWFRED